MPSRFQPLHQSRRRLDRAFRYRGAAVEFLVGDQLLIMRINEMVQDFTQRASCDSQVQNELLVFEPAHMAFGDVSGIDPQFQIAG
ncbi:MAG TPA: hypothetical protein VFZ31_00580 [Vicinamibacterales bacterium]